MKKVKNLLIASCVILGLSGCTDWLTIQPETQITKDDMFKTHGGFYDALIGCYTLMRENYSPDGMMVMGGVEYMANMWYSVSEKGTAYEFIVHDYRADLVERNLSEMFLLQYQVIANLNTLLEYIDIQENVLTEQEAALYKGEALGLRAFVHFDLIRLWGPIPAQVNEGHQYLPYVTTVSLKNYPYSTYRDYMTRLRADLDSAEVLLQQADPIVKANKTDLRRQFRMNYFAVLGLQARVHLWLGEQEEALRYARLVKDATFLGQKQFTLGDQQELNLRDRVFARGEQLFGLELEDFNDNKIADGDLAAYKQTVSRVSELYPADDIRSQLWFAANGDFRSSNKYDKMASTDAVDEKAPYCSTPLIRLSEMYLIIAECADLAEANAVYMDFLATRGLPTTVLTERNRKEVLQLEYLKEFYGEGQMFYAYKRLGTVNMRWSSRENGEDDYVLPLPLRELGTVENY